MHVGSRSGPYTHLLVFQIPHQSHRPHTLTINPLVLYLKHAENRLIHIQTYLYLIFITNVYLYFAETHHIVTALNTSTHLSSFQQGKLTKGPTYWLSVLPADNVAVSMWVALNLWILYWQLPEPCYHLKPMCNTFPTSVTHQKYESGSYKPMMYAKVTSLERGLQI